MTVDALFPNFQTARLLGRQTDAASSGQRESDAADANQFASLLSDLDDRSSVVARASLAEATTDDAGADSNEASSVEATSNAPSQMQAFIAVPALDMSWRPAVAAPAPSDESTDAAAAPSEEARSRADVAANEAAMRSSRPSAIDADRRIAESVDVASRAAASSEPIATPQAQSARVSSLQRAEGASSARRSDIASRSPPIATPQVSAEARSDASITFASRPASSRSDSTAGRIAIASSANDVGAGSSDDDRTAVAATPAPPSMAAAVSPDLARSAAAPQRDPSTAHAANLQARPLDATPSARPAAEAVAPRVFAPSDTPIRAAASSRADFSGADVTASAPPPREGSAELGADNRQSPHSLESARAIPSDKTSATSIDATVARSGESSIAAPAATSFVKYASFDDSAPFASPIAMAFEDERASAAEPPVASNSVSAPLEETGAQAQTQRALVFGQPSDRAPVQSTPSAMETQAQAVAQNSDQTAGEAPIAHANDFAPFELREPARSTLPASSNGNAPIRAADSIANLSSLQSFSAEGESVYAPMSSPSPASAPLSAKTTSADSALAADDRASPAHVSRASVALSSDESQRAAFSANVRRSSDVATPSVASDAGARAFAPFELRGEVAPSMTLRMAARDMRVDPSEDLGAVSAVRGDQSTFVAPSSLGDLGVSRSYALPEQARKAQTSVDQRDSMAEAAPASARARTRAASSIAEIAIDSAARSPLDSAERNGQGASSRVADLQSRANGEAMTADASALRYRTATRVEASDGRRGDAFATSIEAGNRQSGRDATPSVASSRASGVTGAALDHGAQTDRTASAAIEAFDADARSPTIFLPQKDSASVDVGAWRSVSTATTPNPPISTEAPRAAPVGDSARTVATASRAQSDAAMSVGDSGASQSVARPWSGGPAESGRVRASVTAPIDNRMPASAPAGRTQSDDPFATPAQSDAAMSVGDSGASQLAMGSWSGGPAESGRVRDSFTAPIDNREPASAPADRAPNDDRASAAPTDAAAIPSFSAVAGSDAPRAAFTAPTTSAPQRDRMTAVRPSDRISANDRRTSASTAPVASDASTVAASFADAGGVDAARYGDDRNSDRRPMAATDDMRSSTFDASADMATPTTASAGTPVASKVSVTPSVATIDDGASAAAPEPIGTLAILAPATQLPTAFAELLAPQARSLIASASLASSATVTTAPASNIGEGQRQSVAPKILTIELEPAALGAVTVKMKLAHSGIDMRISVESTEALHRLDATREKLVEAMQSSGCTIDSCTIQIGQSVPDGANAQAAPDNGGGFAQTGGGGREEQSVGRQGAGYGGAGGDRRRGDNAENGERGTNGEPRRVADRRGGGDVYL